MKKFYLHPEYTAMQKTWQRYRDFYEGIDGVMRSSYLNRFAIEDKSLDGQAAWEQRQLRTFYVNFCEPILSIWISMLFKKCPDFSKVTDVITEDEQDNIDGNGTSLEVFLKQFALEYLKYGKAGLFVDAPSIQSNSAGQDTALGLRPYGEIWDPLSICDWQIETINGVNRGKYNALHQQFLRIPQRTLDVEPVFELIRRELKIVNNAYNIQLYKAAPGEGQNKATTPEALWALGVSPSTVWSPVESPRVITEFKEIPVVIAEGESWLKEIQPLCERYYNLDSNHDNIIYFQGYARVVIASDTEPASTQKASEQSMMRIPQGATVTQITAEDPTASEKNRAELRNMIFRVGLNQIRQLDGGSQQVQSADTIREEKENVYSLAKEIVEDLESYTNQFVRHWAAFKKKTDYTNEIEFNKDFSSQDYDDFLKLYSAFQARRATYPQTAKALDKKLVEMTEVPGLEDFNKEIDTAKEPAPEPQQGPGQGIINRFVNNARPA